MPKALLMERVLCPCQEQLVKSGLWGGGHATVGETLSPTHVGESVFSFCSHSHLGRRHYCPHFYRGGNWCEHLCALTRAPPCYEESVFGPVRRVPPPLLPLSFSPRFTGAHSLTLSPSFLSPPYAPSPPPESIIWPDTLMFYRLLRTVPKRAAKMDT